QGRGEDVRDKRPGRRPAATEHQMRAGTRGPVAGHLPGHRPRLPPEQAALEHGHPRRLTTGPDGDRYARRLLRPGRRVPAEGPPARRVTPRWAVSRRGPRAAWRRT